MPSAPDYIDFGGERLKGYVQPIQLPPFALAAFRASYPGTNGQSELISGRAGRAIQFQMVLDESRWSSAAVLASYVQRTLQNDLIGRHGDLMVHTRNNWPVFRNCTFEGFALIGPIIPDVAGTMFGRAFCMGTFVFRQLQG